MAKKNPDFCDVCGCPILDDDQEYCDNCGSEMNYHSQYSSLGSGIWRP